MKSRVLMCLAAGCLAATPAFAAGDGTPFFFEFQGSGGAIPILDSNNDDSGHSLFTIIFDNRFGPLDKILDLEIELRGLTHTEPADLDIYLYNQFGENVELMTDSGGSESIGGDGVDLFFSDIFTNVPSSAPLLDGGLYNPEGSGSLTGLANPRSDVWILLITDDSPGDAGNLNQWFLRGHGVPEPMSLSLMAVGALALVRRRFFNF